ncbi:hypothetical protein D3C86_2077480 [compost metagenome]
MSVAVEKPAEAEARMRSRLGVRSLTMPVMAASDRLSASSASKATSLSSCMSLE